jgi:hydrocephalus-inducing protein
MCKFYAVNPTNLGYEFEWNRIEDNKLPAWANPSCSYYFKCNAIRGIILSGKKYEMNFDYLPEVILIF